MNKSWMEMTSNLISSFRIINKHPSRNNQLEVEIAIILSIQSISSKNPENPNNCHLMWKKVKKRVKSMMMKIVETAMMSILKDN